MPLIVEDGTIVADANTLVDETVAAAFFTARGLTAPDNWEAALLKSMNILSGLYYCGTKTDPSSSLDFPRTGIANKDGVPYSENYIPKELIEAQLWLTHYSVEGNDLGAVATPAVKKEKVDVLETEFFAPKQEGSGNTTKLELADLPNAYNLLRHLIDKSRSNSGYAWGNGRVEHA